MTTQIDNGKAFERALAEELSLLTGLPIAKEAPEQNAPGIASQVSSNVRFRKAASLAASHILSREGSNLSAIRATHIRFGTDSSGQKGDVRDVIIVGEGGELGFSCKSNHAAFKHQRLSGRIDFVKKWGLSPDGCSETYWNSIRPVFSELAELKRKSNGTLLWESLVDKPNRFYWPILAAFAVELERVISSPSPSSKLACAQLVRYIIGVQDFYKVICRANRVELLAFNHGGTLEGKTTKYPDHLYKIDTKNGGQYSKTVVLNHGYSFNFRIHNKSKRVEPSLAFAVGAIGLPPEIYTHTISF